MANCKIVSVDDSVYKELLHKHNNNNKAALDEYISSKALLHYKSANSKVGILKADVTDINSTVIPHSSNTTIDFTVPEETYATNIITNYVAQTIHNIETISLAQAEAVKDPKRRKYYVGVAKAKDTKLQDTTLEDVDSIKQLSTDLFILRVNKRLSKLTPTQRAFNKKVVLELNKSDSVLWDKVKTNLRLQYGYVINDYELIDDADAGVTNNWNENAQFKINVNDKLNADLKLYINSIMDVNPDASTVNDDGNVVYEEQTDNFGGIPKTLNYKDIVPALMDYLPESTSVDDMMLKLKNIADVKHPALIKLYNRLQKSEDLRNSLFVNFYKPAPKRTSNKITNKDGVTTVTPVFHNKSGYSTYRLADKWVQNVVSNLVRGNFTPELVKDQNDTYSALYDNVLQTSDLLGKIKLLNKLFNNLGIDTSIEGIQHIIGDPANRNLIDVPANIANSFKPNGKKLTVDELKESFIDNEIIITKLLTPISYITNSIKSYKVGDTFDHFGVVLHLAEQFRLFNAPMGINTYYNTDGELEFSNNNPSYIDDFFTIKEDKTQFLHKMQQLALDPIMQFSNWLFGANGLLDVPVDLINDDGTLNITEESIHKLTLNDLAYQTFDYSFYVGAINDTTKIGNNYVELSDNDWDLEQFSLFNNSNIKTKGKINKHEAAYHIPVPADRGNTRLLHFYKYVLNANNYQNNKLTKNTPAYIAVKNTVYQEMARMIQAAKLIEAVEINEANGNIDFTFNHLIEGYHYVIIDGVKQIKDANGSYLGNAFNFYNTNFINAKGNVESLNDIISTSDVLNNATPYLNTALNNKIDAHLEGFVANLITLEQNHYAKHSKFITDTVGTDSDTSIAELAINYYLANVEMVNMFIGSPAFYGNVAKAGDTMNKRVTELLASGNSNAGFNTNKTFKSITIKDGILKTSSIRKKIVTQLLANKVDTKIANTIGDFYTNINVGDGQSYITLDEFKNRLQLSGLLTKYKPLLDTIENPDIVNTNDDINRFIQLQKNFYYSYEYNKQLGVNVPVQIKNSEFVLIPKFIKGSQLETLNTIITRNKVGQVNFESAQKVGITNKISLLDSALNLQDSGSYLDDVINESAVMLPYSGLKRQQDIVNHIKDSKNKLGSQIARAIITNINKPDLIKNYFDILTENITEDSKDLLVDMGISMVDGEYSIDNDKLSVFIQREITDRGLNDNYVDGITLNDLGEPNIPLDFNVQRGKYISILTSLFTNRIVNQKFPGTHGPQLSNALMANASESIKNGQLDLFSKLDDSKATFRKLEYQRYENGKFKSGEVLMPAWSKKFFTNGERISIEDLQKAGLASMLGYRIPTEDKHSVFVFNVVGFLDESQGSTIVVPDEFIAQTGSDFDIDSVYTMMFNHYTKADGSIHKHKYYNTNEKLWNAKYEPTINFLSKLDAIIDSENNADIFNDVTSSASVLLQSIFDTIPDSFNDTELNDILTENGYSLKTYKAVSDRISKFPNKEDFINKSVVSNNSRKARENRILDIYMEIMSDPSTYEEIATASSFTDTDNATKASNAAGGIDTKVINYNSRLGQREYRKRVLAGKELKALSVIRDGLNNVCQICDVRINPNAAPIIKYDLTKHTLKELRATFGKENVTKDGIVTHTYIANNASGTFKNILGKLITSYSAQSTAHILDNVKFPLPKGINTYTFKVWKTFADVGSTWDYATKFIDQPILLKLSEHYGESKSAYEEGTPRIYELTKSDYQKQLINLLAEDGVKIPSKLAYKAKLDGTLYIRKEDMETAYGLFGYKTGEQTAFSEDQLDTMLYRGNPIVLDTLTTKEKISYLKGQLRLLENFIIYDSIAKELGVLNAVTSFDKATVGPTFETATNRINKIHTLLHTKNPILSINGESPVVHIFPNYLKDTYNTANEDIIDPIIESKYPVLETYLKEGFLTPIRALAPKFINFSNGFTRLEQLLPNNTEDNIISQLHTHTIAYGLRNLPFFNSTPNIKSKVLGTTYQNGTDLDITVYDDDTVEKFKNLPAAVKLSTIKDQYADFIDDHNILNYMRRVYDAEFFKTNGHMGIKYNSPMEDNVMIASFADLWYNSNPYVHLLAQDLIKYSYFTNGLSFGKTSISTIIPSQILYNAPTVLTTTNGVDILNGIGMVDEFNKFKVLNTDRQFSEFNYSANFAINFARSNSRNAAIVPRVSTKWEIDVSGNTDYVVADRTPNWKLNKQKVIVLSEKEYQRLPHKIKAASVVNALYHTGTRKSSKFGLFAYSPQIGYGEVIHYFIPVTPLERFEFSDTSYNVKNNIHPDTSITKSLNEYQSDLVNVGYDNVGFETVETEEVYAEMDDILSIDESDELRNTKSIILNRSTNVADTIDLVEGQSKHINLDDISYIITNLGYNVINNTGARRWQYAVSIKPESDTTLRSTVTELVGDPEVIEATNKHIEHIRSRIVAYDKRLLVYKHDEALQNVNKALSAIDFTNADYNKYLSSVENDDTLTDEDRTNAAKDFVNNEHDKQALALNIDYNYSYRIIEDLKDTLHNSAGIGAVGYLDDIADNVDKQHELTDFLSYANTVLKGLRQLKRITVIDKANLTKGELDINAAIEKLQSLSKDIDVLTAGTNDLITSYFNGVLTPLSTNPDILHNLKSLFSIGDDESKVQLFLDSLADTNNPFIANFVKRYIVQLGRSKNEYVAKQRAFAKRMKSVASIDYLLERNPDGTTTNKFIREFDESYKQTLSDYHDKLEAALLDGKYSTNYYNVEKEFNQWKADNLSNENLHELVSNRLQVQDILNSNFAAREQLEQIRNEEYEITNRYKVSISAEDISKADAARLKELKFQRKVLASNYGTDNQLKSKDNIAIATTIRKFNKAMNEYTFKYSVSEVDSNFQKLLNKHLASNSKESRDWLNANTTSAVTDAFNSKLTKAFATLNTGNKDNVKSSTIAPYKDENGVINGTIIPDELVAVIKEIEEAANKEITDEGTHVGISKPIKTKSNIVHTKSYQDMMTAKGYSANASEIENTIIKINNILNQYDTDDDNPIDYTTIGIDHLSELIDLKSELDILNGNDVISQELQDWKKWYSDNHISETDNKAFMKSNAIAKSKGPDYYAKWRAFNTTLVIDPKYYKLLDDIRTNIFGVFKQSKNDNINPNAEIEIDKLSGELLRKSLGNVDDFDKLSAEGKDRVDAKGKTIIAPANHNTLASLLKDGYSYVEDVNGIPMVIEATPTDIDDLQANVKIAYENSKSSKQTTYKDAINNISKLLTTNKYDELLTLHGTDSTWYLNNHTLDYKGDVIPIALWTNSVPKDSKLYNKHGADKRFWGKSKVNSDRYIDATKTEAKTWVNENVEFKTTDYYDKAKLANVGNKEWFNANHVVNPYTGKLEPLNIWKQMVPINKKFINDRSPNNLWTNLKTKPEFVNPEHRELFGHPLPKTTSKYYNSKFDTIKNDDTYKYLKTLLSELTSHITGDTLMDDGQLPISFKSNDKSIKGVAKTLLKGIGIYDKKRNVVIGENDEIIRFLDLAYLNKITKESLLPKIERIDSMSDEEFLKLKLERKTTNAEISKKNDEYQNANLNRDFVSIINSFIQSATDNKYKANFESEVKLALEQSKKLVLTRTDARIGRVRDKLTSKFTPKGLNNDTDDLAKTSSEDSNIHKHFEMFIKMIYYNEFEANEGNVAKVARVIQNFTSAKGMWLNVPGAFNNVAYGKTQIAIERFSGYFFNNADRIKAEKAYWRASIELLSVASKKTTNNLDVGIIRAMDVVELQDEQAVTGNPEIDKHLIKRIASTNTMYALHHMGEHYMQNASMLAMMHSNHIVDGDIKSWGEYSFDFRHKAFNEAIIKEERIQFDKFVEANKSKDIYLNGQSDLLRDYILKSDTKVQMSYMNTLDELTKRERIRFESTPTLYSAYELVDGYATLKKDIEINPDKVILFRRKVLSVNQKIHGIYNKLDANIIQHVALGRMAMQFRKFLRPGWNKRFGSKFGKKYWNESRNEYEQGSYVAFTKFLTKPIIDNLNKDLRQTDEFNAVTAFKNIAKDYVHFAKNVKLYWNTLDNSDKTGVLRTLTEIGYTLGVMALGAMLRGLGDDDDELKNTKHFAYMLYLQDRLQSELRTYEPIFGWFNESKKMISSPFAATTTIEDMLSLVYTALFESSDDYRGGLYSKENKLKIKSYKMAPIVNRYLRYDNIESYAGYFKLFSY